MTRAILYGEVSTNDGAPLSPFNPWLVGKFHNL